MQRQRPLSAREGWAANVLSSHQDDAERRVKRACSRQCQSRFSDVLKATVSNRSTKPFSPSFVPGASGFSSSVLFVSAQDSRSAIRAPTMHDDHVPIWRQEPKSRQYGWHLSEHPRHASWLKQSCRPSPAAQLVIVCSGPARPLPHRGCSRAHWGRSGSSRLPCKLHGERGYRRGHSG